MSSDRPDETFAALFEKTGAVPSRRPGARVGEVLDATVVQVGKDAVFVELPGQRQGLIEAIDLRAPDGTMNVAVGTRLRARVARSDAENGIRLVPTIDAAALVGASVSVGGRSEADAVKVAVGHLRCGPSSRALRHLRSD